MRACMRALLSVRPTTDACVASAGVVRCSGAPGRIGDKQRQPRKGTRPQTRQPLSPQSSRSAPSLARYLGRTALPENPSLSVRFKFVGE
jgi:hypothetical protein